MKSIAIIYILWIIIFIESCTKDADSFDVDSRTLAAALTAVHKPRSIPGGRPDAVATWAEVPKPDPKRPETKCSAIYYAFGNVTEKLWMQQLIAYLPEDTRISYWLNDGKLLILETERSEQSRIQRYSRLDPQSGESSPAGSVTVEVGYFAAMVLDLGGDRLLFRRSKARNPSFSLVVNEGDDSREVVLPGESTQFIEGMGFMDADGEKVLALTDTAGQVWVFQPDSESFAVEPRLEWLGKALHRQHASRKPGDRPRSFVFTPDLLGMKLTGSYLIAAQDGRKLRIKVRDLHFTDYKGWPRSPNETARVMSNPLHLRSEGSQAPVNVAGFSELVPVSSTRIALLDWDFQRAVIISGKAPGD